MSIGLVMVAAASYVSWILNIMQYANVMKCGANMLERRDGSCVCGGIHCLHMRASSSTKIFRSIQTREPVIHHLNSPLSSPGITPSLKYETIFSIKMREHMMLHAAPGTPSNRCSLFDVALCSACMLMSSGKKKDHISE